jgi:hypothetical protein
MLETQSFREVLARTPAGESDGGPADGSGGRLTSEVVART